MMSRIGIWSSPRRHISSSAWSIIPARTFRRGRCCASSRGKESARTARCRDAAQHSRRTSAACWSRFGSDPHPCARSSARGTVTYTVAVLANGAASIVWRSRLPRRCNVSASGARRSPLTFAEDVPMSPGRVTLESCVRRGTCTGAIRPRGGRVALDKQLRRREKERLRRERERERERERWDERAHSLFTDRLQYRLDASCLSNPSEF